MPSDLKAGCLGYLTKVLHAAASPRGPRRGPREALPIRRRPGCSKSSAPVEPVGIQPAGEPVRRGASGTLSLGTRARAQGCGGGLELSVKTVETYRSRVLHKLHCGMTLRSASLPFSMVS